MDEQAKGLELKFGVGDEVFYLVGGEGPREDRVREAQYVSGGPVQVCVWAKGRIAFLPADRIFNSFDDALRSLGEYDRRVSEAKRSGPVFRLDPADAE